MNRANILIVLFFNVGLLFSQEYSFKNIKLIKKFTPEDSPIKDSLKIPKIYSGSWRWYQKDKNREYAIVCGSRNSYFIDVTKPFDSYICDSIKGVGLFGEVKVYKNYAYILTNTSMKNGIKIIDMKYLPDSVHVLNDTSYIFPGGGHTLWIDNEYLYISSHRIHPSPVNPIAIYNLNNPEKPRLICKSDEQIPFLLGVHDIFVKNDTIYASAAYQGLYILKFNPSDSSLNYLGSYSDYSSTPAYNHSSFLTENGKYLVFMDEIPNGMPIRIVNVENTGNIYEVSNFIPYEKTVPHNPFIIGNNLILASCYEDGLIIYNMSDPYNVKIAGYFDTHPQSGANTGIYIQGASFNGAWGAYPTFSNNCVVVSDMQNGIFILDISDVYKELNEVSKKEKIMIYPIPTNSIINIEIASSYVCELTLTNALGQIVLNNSYTNVNKIELDLRNFANGVYTVILNTENQNICNKIIVYK